MSTHNRHRVISSGRVRAIAATDGTVRGIAERFRCSPATVSLIQRGELHRDLTAEVRRERQLHDRLRAARDLLGQAQEASLSIDCRLSVWISAALNRYVTRLWQRAQEVPIADDPDTRNVDELTLRNVERELVMVRDELARRREAELEWRAQFERQERRPVYDGPPSAVTFSQAEIDSMRECGWGRLDSLVVREDDDSEADEAA